MFGIALSQGDLPVTLIQRFRLEERIHRRSAEAEPEIHFLDRQRPRLLPAWVEGRLLILPWGQRELWCPIETLAAGRWQHREPLEVLIPCSFAFDHGVWYLVREGLRGILVTEGNRRIVYPLTQPATHYHEVMTRSSRMVIPAR
jgi:hypothetical protein